MTLAVKGNLLDALNRGVAKHLSSFQQGNDDGFGIAGEGRGRGHAPTLSQFINPIKNVSKTNISSSWHSAANSVEISLTLWTYCVWFGRWQSTSGAMSSIRISSSLLWTTNVLRTIRLPQFRHYWPSDQTSITTLTTNTTFEFQSSYFSPRAQASPCCCAVEKETLRMILVWHTTF